MKSDAMVVVVGNRREVAEALVGDDEASNRGKVDSLRPSAEEEDNVHLCLSDRNVDLFPSIAFGLPLVDNLLDDDEEEEVGLCLDPRTAGLCCSLAIDTRIQAVDSMIDDRNWPMVLSSRKKRPEISDPGNNRGGDSFDPGMREEDDDDEEDRRDNRNNRPALS